MKKQILILATAMIFLMAIMQISGEMNLWNEVSNDQSQSLTKYSALYTFDDTSARGIGKNKDIPLTFVYSVMPLPFNLTTNGSAQVDWCNFTIVHYHNIYGTSFVAFEGFYGGELLNTTIETQSYYFSTNGSSAGGQVTFDMRDKDYLMATMKCHYTDPAYLYDGNILVGNFETLLPSYECEGCTKYSLEEISNEIERKEQVTQNELSIYQRIQTVIYWNFQIWLIMSWVIKISLILVAVGFVFAGVYSFYLLLKDLSENI
jgi:hypothetical protein